MYVKLQAKLTAKEFKYLSSSSKWILMWMLCRVALGTQIVEPEN